MNEPAVKNDDKLRPYVWVLKCGCETRYRTSPPRVGDEVTCRIHGPTKVVRRVKP